MQIIIEWLFFTALLTANNRNDLRLHRTERNVCGRLKVCLAK